MFLELQTKLQTYLGKREPARLPTMMHRSRARASNQISAFEGLEIDLTIFGQTFTEANDIDFDALPTLTFDRWRYCVFGFRGRRS